MSWFDFASYPLWLNALAFLAAAGAVWIAGTCLATYADAISDLTGLGSALVGMLLLGGITSLPEIAVSVTAGLAGNAGLAVNNILGGVALQVAVIALGDAALRGRAISASVGTPTVLLQAAFSCLLLCLVVAGVVVGDLPLAGVGLWSTAILGTAVLLLWLISRYKGNETWRPHPSPQEPRRKGEGRGRPQSLGKAIALTCVVAAVIVGAGFVLARSGDALAQQTGLGASFVGALFVGLSTSLPEISTVLAAVRLRRYLMAFSDIFGTNIFDVALIFLIDATYRGPPVLNEVGAFSAFGAVLGIALTLMYLSGLIERRDKTVGRLGIDSWAVVAVYLGGVAILYSLR